MLDVIFAQLGDQAGPLALTTIGVVVAAIAGTYRGFLSANSKAEADRLNAAVQQCELRCKAQEDRLWLLAEQLREERAKSATWQTRCESLGWGAGNPKSSPTRNDPA